MSRPTRSFFGLAILTLWVALSAPLTLNAKANDVTVDSFVVLEIRFTLPEAKVPQEGVLSEYALPVDRPEAVPALTGQTVRLAAVAVSSDVVLARDPGISEGTIESITAVNAHGQKGSAELMGRLNNLPGLAFRLKGISVRPLTSSAEIPPDGAFLSQTLLFVDEKWHLHGEPSTPEPLWDAPTTLVMGTGLSDTDLDLGLILFNQRRVTLSSPAVITRNGSQPLALGFSSGFYLEDGKLTNTLPVTVPAAEDLLPAKASRDVLTKVETAATRSTVPVRIVFRQATGADEPPEDVEALGILIGGYVFVPKAISRAQAALIDRVVLIGKEGQELSGEFVGAFKNFDGYLIRPPIDVPASWQAPEPAKEGIALYRLCVATDLNWSFGTRYFQARFTRPYDRRNTFFGEADYSFTGVVTDGTAIWSPEGKLLGVVVQESFAYQELAELLPPPTPSLGVYLTRNRPGDRFLPASTLEEMLRDVTRHLDPRVRVRQPGEEHRRVWLGVEFTRVTKDLADALGCRRETRDGSIGLLVQLVYPDSPAARAGIQPGDILLALSTPDLPFLIEFTGMRRSTGNVRDIFERIMRARAMGGRRRPSGPWPSRENYLTELLGILGEGTPVRVIYWRGRQVHVVSTTLELAPPDQDSAPQYKDSRLGLTVKDLTYEVRAALRLGPDAAGVVVADVESGAPAAQARLQPGELIVSVDDKEIFSSSDFQQAIEKARNDGKASVRLRVVERGRSRFVDMQLE